MRCALFVVRRWLLLCVACCMIALCCVLNAVVFGCGVVAVCVSCLLLLVVYSCRAMIVLCDVWSSVLALCVLRGCCLLVHVTCCFDG